MSEQHRHEWLEQLVESVDLATGETTAARRFGCRECAEVALPCETCARPNESANRSCSRCIDGARRVLADIDEAAQTPFAAMVVGPQAIRYDRSGGKGGRREESLPFGLDSTLTDPDAVELLQQRRAARPDASTIELMRDPANVLEPLHTWSWDWAEKLGVTPAGVVTKWLADHLVWAANNPELSDWPQYLEEAFTVRKRLRRLVGLAPEIEPAPCAFCGGQVVRDWTGDDGLSDVRRCTGCAMTWGDRARLDFANLTHLRALPRTMPDQLVTIDGARATLPTARRGQLRLVMHRDRKRIARGERPRIPIAGTDERGRELYRLADVWMAADPDAGVTAEEAIAAVRPELRDHLAQVLTDVDDDGHPTLEPIGKLHDGRQIYRLGAIAEAAEPQLREDPCHDHR